MVRFLLAIVLALSVAPIAKATDTCEDAHFNYQISHVSKFKLVVRGADKVWHELKLKLDCRDGIQFFEDYVTVTDADAFVKSFSKVGIAAPYLAGTSIDVMTDDMTGEVEPTITLNIQSGKNVSTKAVIRFSWSERQPSDPLYGKKFLYFETRATIHETQRDGTWDGKPTLSLETVTHDPVVSWAKLGPERMSLKTNPLLESGKERDFMISRSQEYGGSLTLGSAYVRKCTLSFDEQEGEIVGRCNGLYEEMEDDKPTGSLGDFQCRFEMKYSSGFVEVLNQTCRKQ